MVGVIESQGSPCETGRQGGSENSFALIFFFLLLSVLFRHCSIAIQIFIFEVRTVSGSLDAELLRDTVLSHH